MYLPFCLSAFIGNRLDGNTLGSIVLAKGIKIRRGDSRKEQIKKFMWPPKAVLNAEFAGGTSLRDGVSAG